MTEKGRHFRRNLAYKLGCSLNSDYDPASWREWGRYVRHVVTYGASIPRAVWEYVFWKPDPEYAVVRVVDPTPRNVVSYIWNLILNTFHWEGELRP